MARWQRNEYRSAGKSHRRVSPRWRRLRVESLERREMLAVNLVSASLGGGSGEHLSANPQISEDGRFAIFESSSNNLVAGDVNSPAITDIFRRDLLTGVTVLVSANLSSSGGNGNSSNGRISSDGRYVTFLSSATDLQATVIDSNNNVDVFVRDMQLNQTLVLSRNVNQTATGAGASGSPNISDDGRFVVFHSAAPDLVLASLDTNGTVLDVFLWDRNVPNQVTLLSTPFGSIGSGNGPSSFAVISGNGTQVSFVSSASNLVVNDTNGIVQDVFVRPVSGGSTTLVSANTTGGSGNQSSNDPRISDDGNWIAFTSNANNLATGDGNGVQDIFLRNRVAGTTILISTALGGIASANGISANPVISGDGMVVGYTSAASNIVSVDVNGAVQDVFVRNRNTSTTLLVSASLTGTTGNNLSGEPSLNFDGRFVAFSSAASNLVSNDTNGPLQDVFRRDTTSNVTILVSTSISGFSGNGSSFTPSIDDGGQNIVFASVASNLVVNDTNFAIQDVFHFIPTLPPAPTQRIVTDPDHGASFAVRVLNAGNFAEVFAINPFPGFTGGVRVATGDVTGDGVADIITAAGPGASPHVRMFDGTTGGQVAGPIGSFFAYNPAFGGGVFVAAGDVTGDGRADIITGPGLGGGPHVRIFNGVTGAEVRGFFAYNAAFTGGVAVAAGDVDADGRADIITGAGAGGGPHVRVFSGLTGAEIFGFNAYNPAFGGGVWVSAGDINGDGRADVITGAGQGGGPHVRVINIVNRTEIFGFNAFPGFTGGVRVGSVDANNDGRVDIIVGTGPGIQTALRIFSGINRAQLSETSPYPGFTGGVFVAGTKSVAPFGSPVRAAEGASPLPPEGSVLDAASLDAIAAAALARLAVAGVPQETLDRLDHLPIGVADLPADLLGLSSAGSILLDRDAAGHGWFIDATPQDDVEFVAAGDVLLAHGGAASGMDLLSVLVHELGHALGLEDLDPHLFDADAMASRLAPGARRTMLAVDAVFSE